MVFSLPHHWVWDLWLADDGDLFHMFYLHAPRSLGDPQLRHHNARIGHATSRDLRNWQDHGRIFDAGRPGAFDETATWTGSVLRGPDGIWRMFYTGVVSPSDGAGANIESVGLATSVGLYDWTKAGQIVRADSRWYETFGASSWRHETWRDPWVFADPDGSCWHMLVTARANRGPVDARGVVGHALSRDLREWEVMPPLSAPNTGFGYLEVSQIVAADDGHWLIFSCDAAKLCGERKGHEGGIWRLTGTSAAGPYAVADAQLLAPEPHYAGRVIRDRQGRLVLLAFQADLDGTFAGAITDPMPVA